VTRSTEPIRPRPVMTVVDVADALAIGRSAGYALQAGAER